MSRTVQPDGSVRFHPNRGHRSKRKVPVGQVLIPLAVVVPVGVNAVRSLGVAVAVPIVAVTAVVTLAAVLAWRMTLPRLVHVTARADRITYARYGRRSTVLRDGDLRMAARTIVMQHEMESPYLVVSGTGDPFLLNLDMWSEQDVAGIVALVPEAQQDPTPGRVTVMEMRTTHPGAMPAHMAHPNRTAVLAILVAVPVVVAGMYVVGSVLADDPEDPRTSAAPVARSTRVPDADLPRPVVVAQNRLQAEAQELLGPASTWRPVDVVIADCEDVGGTQRVIEWIAEDASSTPSTRTVRAVDALAEDGQMVAGMRRTSPVGMIELSYQHGRTGAFLRVQGDGSTVSVTTGSDCVATG